MIIDDHEVSRAALRALLRTEGFEVADVGKDDDPVGVAVKFRPVAVVVDVAPGESAGFAIAVRLAALGEPPAVVLTSSVGRQQFDRELAGQVFIAKADLCGTAIVNQIAGALDRH
jgi:DNA-binding response OmpR family regulator